MEFIHRLSNGKKVLVFFEGLKDGFSTKTIRYLYVTTYQNDNYRFSENHIDIDQTLRMLESA